MKKFTVKISDNLIDSLLDEAKKNDIQKLVVGAIISNNNTVLLLKRCANEFMPGLVELPSGGIDNDEKLIDGLVREVKEESGLDVLTVEKYVSFFDYKSGSGKNARQFNFKVTTSSNKVILNPQEHDSFVWLPLSEIETTSLNVSNHTRSAVLQSL